MTTVSAYIRMLTDLSDLTEFEISRQDRSVAGKSCAPALMRECGEKVRENSRLALVAAHQRHRNKQSELSYRCGSLLYIRSCRRASQSKSG